MYTRPAIAGPLACYASAILISASIHGLLLRRPWSPSTQNKPVEIQFQQGIHAVELTLIPSIAASEATKPKPDQPRTKPQPKTEPIKEIPPEPDAEMFVPAPSPEPEEIAEVEKAPPEEPKEILDQEEPEPVEQESIASIEQAGSMQPHGVWAETLNGTKPTYPRRSRIQGEEGSVTLRFLIATNGDLLDVTVEKSSGFKRLDNSALSKARTISFPAAPDSTQAVKEILWTFTFNLE